MVVFKVVEKQTRWCSNWMIFKHSYQIGECTSSWFSAGVRFRKKHPEYFPRYLKGHIIYAAPNSAGIMCFLYKSQAEKFRKRHSCDGNAFIIKVRGIGTPRVVEEVVNGCGVCPWFLLDYGRECFLGVPPFGTRAFEAVEVLD